jgi:hypothetical protein
MSTARDINNPNRLVDWSDEINELDNQYGFVKSQNYFRSTNISQLAVVFDKVINEITLLPQSARNSRQGTVGKDRIVQTFSLPLAYFRHEDYITPDDIQGQRKAGESDTEETLANVRVTKLEDMRFAADSTDEYLQLQALKGVMKSPDGGIIADMFAEFSITQTEVDFLLGTATTDVDGKIQELKRAITSSIKTGTRTGGVTVYTDSSFYNKLISHPKMREAYILYQNSGKQLMRDDLSMYMEWGIVDTFEHKGVRFFSYDASFNLPNGTQEKAFETDEGTAFATGVRDLFRGYNGPANTLSGANAQGREMFVTEYTDPKDQFHELTLEMSKLYFCTKPASLVKVSTSN